MLSVHVTVTPCLCGACSLPGTLRSLVCVLASPYHGCRVDAVAVLICEAGYLGLEEMSSRRSHRPDVSVGSLARCDACQSRPCGKLRATWEITCPS